MYGMSSFSKTSVTFNVTSTGSLCMAVFPIHPVRQVFARQQISQFAAQLGFAGLRILHAQAGQRMHSDDAFNCASMFILRVGLACRHTD